MQDLSIKMYGCEVRIKRTTARFGRLLGEPRDGRVVGLNTEESPLRYS